MAILVVTNNGVQSIFKSMRDFASVSKDFVSQYGSINKIVPNYTPNTPAGACPECGSPIAVEEGCRKCHSCGYSACG